MLYPPDSESFAGPSESRTHSVTHSEPKSRTSDAEPFNQQAYRDSSDDDEDNDDDNDDGNDDDAPSPAAAIPSAPPVSPSAVSGAPLRFQGDMEELVLQMQDGNVSPAPSTATEPCQWRPGEK